MKNEREPFRFEERVAYYDHKYASSNWLGRLLIRCIAGITKINLLLPFLIPVLLGTIVTWLTSAIAQAFIPNLNPTVLLFVSVIPALPICAGLWWRNLEFVQFVADKRDRENSKKTQDSAQQVVRRKEQL